MAYSLENTMWVPWQPNFRILTTGHITGSGADQGDVPQPSFYIDGVLAVQGHQLCFRFTKHYLAVGRYLAYSVEYSGTVFITNNHFVWSGTWRHPYGHTTSAFYCYAPRPANTPTVAVNTPTVAVDIQVLTYSEEPCGETGPTPVPVAAPPGSDLTLASVPRVAEEDSEPRVAEENSDRTFTTVAPLDYDA